MSIRHLTSEIEKGLKSPVYFLYAEDRYLLKEAAHMIAGTIPESERAFSYDVFDLDSIDEIPHFEQIVDILNTVPFMGGRRVVAIENVQELSKKNSGPLDGYVSKPSSQAVLVLFHLGSPKALFRDVLKKLKAVSLDIRRDEIPSWIGEKARSKGLSLTNDAIGCLLDVIGPEAGLLASEIEKLALLGKSQIDAQDISDIVAGSSDYSVFDLVNAIRDKDREKVFVISKALRETQESYGLLGAINWHYSRMSEKERGRTGYYTKVFELLNEADIRIKTSGGTFPLEYLLIRLLQI